MAWVASLHLIGRTQGMKRVPRNARSARAHEEGFSRVDVAVVLGVVVFVAVAWLPALGRSGSGQERVVCQANIASLARAVAMYAVDNADALPHPSWGSLSSSPGPDNWCYATSMPGVGKIPNLMGRDGPFAHTNQLPFYAAGQLARFARGQQEFMCPLDWERATGAGIQAIFWRERELKLTSYTMNGAVCGYGGSREVASASSGVTYKLSAFTPLDRVLWEVDETLPFNFNDAASNPSNGNEGVSQRHGWFAGDNEAVAFSDGAIVGRMGGGAEFVPWESFNELREAPYTARPNELLCGPGF